MPKEPWIDEPHIKSGDANVDVVMQKYAHRVKTGKKKYGVSTERNDLTHEQWLTHLQEELMGGAVYIERLLVEMRKLRD